MSWQANLSEYAARVEQWACGFCVEIGVDGPPTAWIDDGLRWRRATPVEEARMLQRFRP